MRAGRVGGHLSFFSSSPLPPLTVGNLKGMLCLQGATVLSGCVFLYTSFYKFALHKLSVVRTGVCALGRRPGPGTDLSFPGVDLLPGCVDCYAKLSRPQHVEGHPGSVALLLGGTF